MSQTPNEQIRAQVIPALCRNIHTLVDRVLAERPDAVCFDIGANVGGYVGYCLDRGASQVHAFEPVPWVFEEMRRTYGSDPRVQLRRLAIGNRHRVHEGARIYNAHTLARPDEIAPAMRDGITQEDRGPFSFVETRIDDYAYDVIGRPRFTRLDFIKLDVDGYEPAALRGMTETLAKFRPVVMIELSYLPRLLGESCEAMIDWIYARGYRLCTMAGEVCDDPVIVLEAFPWRTSFDMVMVPTERIMGEWPRVR